MNNRMTKVSILRLRFQAIIAVTIAFILIYLGTNHLILRPLRFLPLFDWEKNLPFLPWTVVFYFIAYLQAIGIFLLISRHHIQKVLLGMIGIIAVCGLFFLLWPTAYPRPSLPADTGNISRVLYGFLTAIDRPQNCFPSLHVAISLFAVFVLWRQNWHLGIFFLILSVLGIVSTLTLKQHYFVDVIGGFSLAILSFLLFRIYDSR